MTPMMRRGAGRTWVGFLTRAVPRDRARADSGDYGRSTYHPPAGPRWATCAANLQTLCVHHHKLKTHTRGRVEATPAAGGPGSPESVLHTSGAPPAAVDVLVSEECRDPSWSRKPRSS